MGKRSRSRRIGAVESEASVGGESCRWVVVAVLLVGLWPALVRADSPQLAITEIMYDAPGSDTGREWIELTNTGSETVVLPWAAAGADWRMADSSSHRINRAIADDWLASGERLIISDNPEQFRRDYPAYLGDLAKAALNLANTGGTVRLSLDAGATWITTRTYEASMGGAGDGRTLEWDGENALPSREIGGTPGAARAPIPSQSKIADREQFQVEEIAYNPAGRDTGREWLEVRNIGTTHVALSSATPALLIIDARRHPLHYTGPPATIGPGDRVVLARPASEDVGRFPADSLFLSGAILLPNRPTRLRLSFDNGATFVLDETYDPAWGGNGDGRSLKREPAGDWRASVATAGTPGRPPALAEINHPPAIVISEIFPYPERGGEEWIELANIGPDAADLTGWQLDDGSGGSAPYTIPISRSGGTHLEPGQFIVFRRSETRLILGDKSDRVELRLPSGDLVTATAYGDPPLGASWIRSIDGRYMWTREPSPARTNAIVPMIAWLASSREPQPIVRSHTEALEIIDQDRPVDRRLDNLPGENGWHVRLSGEILDSRARSATLSDGHGTINLRFQLAPGTKPSLSAGDHIRVSGILTRLDHDQRALVVSQPTAVAVIRKSRPSRRKPAKQKESSSLAGAAARSRASSSVSVARPPPLQSLLRAPGLQDSTVSDIPPMLGGLLGLIIWGIYATRIPKLDSNPIDRRSTFG